VANRVREKFEHWIPNESTRRRAFGVVAFAIEIADQQRSDAWYVRETSYGLRLMGGHLLACEITRANARVSVVGPIADDVRAALGADAEDDSEFKSVPGGVVLTFPVELLGEQFDYLKEGMSNFIDLAMTRVRRAPKPIAETCCRFEWLTQARR
jgi:hypothetical protein